jgi:hypothetical protein
VQHEKSAERMKDVRWIAASTSAIRAHHRCESRGPLFDHIVGDGK